MALTPHNLVGYILSNIPHDSKANQHALNLCAGAIDILKQQSDVEDETITEKQRLTINSDNQLSRLCTDSLFEISDYGGGKATVQLRLCSKSCDKAFNGCPIDLIDMRYQTTDMVQEVIFPVREIKTKLLFEKEMFNICSFSNILKPIQKSG